MIDRQREILTATANFTDKQSKKYRTDILIRLQQKILDKSDTTVEQQLVQTIEYLFLAVEDPKQFRQYLRSFRALQKMVRTTFGYTEKGTLANEYIAIGTAIGVALGSAFTTINVAFIGLGIPIGVAIGAAIGQQKEKEAETQGKIY